MRGLEVRSLGKKKPQKTTTEEKKKKQGTKVHIKYMFPATFLIQIKIQILLTVVQHLNSFSSNTKFQL